MSSLTQPITSWTEFLRLPERPENGIRYELHDGEVVVVPPPRFWHVEVQERIENALRLRAAGVGIIRSEWPYRPAPNLQYWVADLAYIPRADWESMPRDADWPVYAPPLIIEVLSPSNTPVKVNRQRMTAMSAGTQEFWIVNHTKKTVEVSRLDGVHVYGVGELISLLLLNGSLKVDDIFA
jgi:Uma2 family endonuclease